MSRFFKPYEGTRPFLFISYAHLQSDVVVDTIRIINDKGYRLWYDEGIPAGSDWPANIALHMQNCERVVFFFSARAMESPNCLSEMRTARRLGKPILVVELDASGIPDNWSDILDGQPVIPIIDSAEDRADAILRSKFLPGRFHRSRLEGVSFRAFALVASLLFFLAAAFALWSIATGRWNPVKRSEISAAATAPTAVKDTESTPVPVIELGEAERFFAVTFPDSQQERAVRRALGIQTGEIYRGQLAVINELHFCGNMTADNTDNVSFDADGTCRVNGAPVITGQVSDLSILDYLVRLEKLSLICQPLKSISKVGGHVLLQDLNLSGSTVTEISSLEDLPSLKTLHIEHTDVSDLTALSALPGLETVTVSRDMLPLIWDEQSQFRIVLVR